MLKFKNAAALKKAVAKYFLSCEGEQLLDLEGNPVIDKKGEIVFVHRHPPTLTGLALAIGFTSAKDLRNFKSDDDAINMALLAAVSLCEYQMELLLFDKDHANNAKFYLSHNFREWSDDAGFCDDSVSSDSALKDLISGLKSGDSY